MREGIGALRLSNLHAGPRLTYKVEQATAESNFLMWQIWLCHPWLLTNSHPVYQCWNYSSYEYILWRPCKSENRKNEVREYVHQKNFVIRDLGPPCCKGRVPDKSIAQCSSHWGLDHFMSPYIVLPTPYGYTHGIANKRNVDVAI